MQRAAGPPGPELETLEFWGVWGVWELEVELRATRGRAECSVRTLAPDLDHRRGREAGLEREKLEHP